MKLTSLTLFLLTDEAVEAYTSLKKILKVHIICYAQEIYKLRMKE